MASDKTYRTFAGVVEFEPREGEAGGKPVRNITISQVGFKEQAVRVSLTLWPSHKAVEVAEGDFVVGKGTYTRNEKTTDEGKRVYHNISVIGILNLGACDFGTRPETTSDDVESGGSADDDDIPF